MEADLVAKSVVKLINEYRDRLKHFDEQTFITQPAPEVWSASEIYHHIFDLSLLSLKVIGSLLKGRGEAGEASLAGKAILASGTFPDGLRFKVPDDLGARLK
ncbi:MAG: hypothetical protein EOO89_24610, partial [Pedobacter sp.]